jgi:hypothetical protein
LTARQPDKGEVVPHLAQDEQERVELPPTFGRLNDLPGSGAGTPWFYGIPKIVDGCSLTFAGGGISSPQNLAGRVAQMRPFLIPYLEHAAVVGK